MDYEAMLKEGIKNLPEDVIESGRFTVPKVIGHIQGNKTIISNFNQIATALNRDPEQFQKYLLKELATPGTITKTALIIGTKVPASKINGKIAQFVKKFVLCSECQKPDTKLEKEQGIIYMKCSACGAKHAVRERL